jgi:hypothetical protein
MAMLCGKCYRFSCQAPISEILRAIWKSGHLRQAHCKRVVRAVNGSINLSLSIFEFADEERCHDQ